LRNNQSSIRRDDSVRKNRRIRGIISPVCRPKTAAFLRQPAADAVKSVDIRCRPSAGYCSVVRLSGWYDWYEFVAVKQRENDPPNESRAPKPSTVPAIALQSFESFTDNSDASTTNRNLTVP